MNAKFACDDTQEMLDRLAAGTLGDGELHALRAHARDCPDCAMLVRIHEHCGAAAGAAVPGEMVDGMWLSISRRIAERSRPTTAPAAPARPRLARWRHGLVPGLAAAVFVLAFACGFLFGELRQVRRQGERLAGELAASRQALDRDRAHGATALQARRAGMLTGLGWRHAIPERDSYRIGELIAMLEQLPPRMSILPAGEDPAYLGGAMYLRGIGTCTRRERVNMRDGLQAEEAVALARCLRVDPDTRISREELFTFIESITGKGARS